MRFKNFGFCEWEFFRYSLAEVKTMHGVAEEYSQIKKRRFYAMIVNDILKTINY